MMQCANNTDKESTVSGVASVDLRMRRVESVRDSFRSTSLWALGRESSRGGLDNQSDGLDHGLNPINVV